MNKNLINIKNKYYKNLNFYNLISVGDLVLIIQKKGNYRFVFYGLVIKKKNTLFNNKIFLLNSLKRNLIVKSFNLYSKSIISIVLDKKYKVKKRNNLNYLQNKFNLKFLFKQ